MLSLPSQMPRVRRGSGETSRIDRLGSGGETVEAGDVGVLGGTGGVLDLVVVVVDAEHEGVGGLDGEAVAPVLVAEGAQVVVHGSSRCWASVLPTPYWIAGGRLVTPWAADSQPDFTNFRQSAN